MSNAMRSGKRMLAGVAAGALGVALVPTMVLTAGPANAAAAASLELQFPSATVIAANNTTGIPVEIALYDASGDDATSLPADTTVRVSVTGKPSNALAVDDTTIGISLFTTDDTVQSDDTTGFENLGFTIGGVKKSDGTAESWTSSVSGGDAGTYTISACLYNSAAGSCGSTTQTMTFTLLGESAASAATVNFLNSAYNAIDHIGVSADDSVLTTPSFQLAISDAKGGPYIVDASKVSVTVSSGSTASITQATGYGRAVLGTYSLSAAAGSDWGSAGTRTVTAAVDPTGSSVVGTGYLPVSVATVNDTPSGISAELNNPTMYQPVTTDDTYQVPPGTTELTFDVSTADAVNAPSTMAWNTTTTATGGAVTPAGGATPVDASAGTVTVKLNAKAAAVGEVARLTFGSYQPPALGDDSTATVNVVFAAPAVTVTGSNGLSKVSTATPITGTVLDQYGATVPGTYGIKAYVGDVSCSTTVTPAGTAAVAADGSFEVTIPASLTPSSPTNSQVYTLCASNGFSTATKGTATWIYTSTGGVNSLTLASTPSNSSTVYPLVRTPQAGVVNLTTPTSATIAYNATASQVSTAVNATTPLARTAVTLTATTSPATTGIPVTFSSTDGALFVKSTTGSVYSNTGAESVTVATTSGSASASVFATKPGTYTVTVTAGETSTTMKFTAAVSAGSGRQVTIDPTSKTVSTNSFHQFTATVTDIYGNPVPDDTAALTLALNGGGTINPAATASFGTGAAGTATVTYTAPNGTGSAQITLAGNNFQTGTIPGAAALIATAKSDITVSTGPDPDVKTIVITGERGTVKGKPGIMVDGVTTGIGEGTPMVPYIKFPGQTSYSAGSARPKVSAIGDFYWQRKTGKKIYVYFATEDGSARSDRIIIQAK